MISDTSFFGVQFVRAFAIALTFSVISSASAIAADLGPISPDINPERFGWSGAYVGASVGYAWLSDADHAFVPPLEDQGDDWNFGGHVGYLQQFGSFVVGAEAEAQALDITYDTFSFIKVNNAYTLKGRAGVAFDRWLVSGHLGGSYLTTNIKLHDWGWAGGAGIDYAVTDHLVLGAEYTHHWFDNFDGTLIDGHIDDVSARVSYKF
jgi:outer membrane immunogenic protein